MLNSLNSLGLLLIITSHHCTYLSWSWCKLEEK